MTGVDVSQLQHKSFVMVQLAEDARGTCDRTRKIHIARSLGSHAMAVHTD